MLLLSTIWEIMLLSITEHILHKIFRIYLIFCWIKHSLRIRISSRACFIWLYWNEVNFYVRPNCARASYRRRRELGTCRTFSVRPDCLAFRKFCCFDEQNFIYTRCRFGSVVYITSVQKQQPYRKQRLITFWGLQKVVSVKNIGATYIFFQKNQQV